MKKVTASSGRKLLFGVFLAAAFLALALKEPSGDKKQIQALLGDFMSCIVKKDSVKFYSLFHQGPVAWVGVFKDKTQQERLLKDSTKLNYFNSNYKSFYRSISDKGADEEKFDNIEITEDGSVASVSFDYGFYENGEKLNWGKETWGLVKINGAWKIASVLFSLEFQRVNPEPGKGKKS